MAPIAPESKTKIVRSDNRAVYDRESIEKVLDSTFLCHVGFTIDGEARVIPTAYVRIDDAVYLHGHLKNQMLNALLDGQTASICITLTDGLVLARSGFKHSVNYRSVTLFGKAEKVADDEKAALLDAFVDFMVPGRSAALRKASQQELNATLVLRVPIDEAAAKIRTGPPLDKDPDYATHIWAGVVNLETRIRGIENCPKLNAGIEVPEHISKYVAQETIFD
ncbi:MAG: pyridoxamine 5'-phosphate oxidase family protein [Gammaproteobacteria bacterium]|nr:pyridoxamine 5'-phosphate oxidase family protein [Gammaproteobacteria bacterium]MDD9895088.1 pyridoxamine 5'-phosphate oxidase family protein [Gammaproteobacteria bacterium]MDD9958015.1 pyridoxamine 5'-phosphate oxidase family protein [Gammaproteobacteria bacterium]